MKKETSVAVFFGIMLGIIVAAVMIVQTKKDESIKSKPLINSLIPKSLLTQPAVQLQGLEIQEPKDSVIVKSKNIKIKGKASKESLIVFQSASKDLILKNPNLEFETDFPLVLGENIIKVTVYPKDKQLRIQEKELKVYYLEE